MDDFGRSVVIEAVCPADLVRGFDQRTGASEHGELAEDFNLHIGLDDVVGVRLVGAADAETVVSED